MGLFEEGDRFKRYEVAFRVWVKYSQALDSDRPSAYEHLLSELCNLQSCLRFFKDSNFRPDHGSPTLGKVAQALFRLERLLLQLDSLEPQTLEDSQLIGYRRDICILTHLAFAHILMHRIYDPTRESKAPLIRLEGFLLAFHDQWHSPILATDLQTWLQPEGSENIEPKEPQPDLDAAGVPNDTGSRESASSASQSQKGKAVTEEIIELPGDFPTYGNRNNGLQIHLPKSSSSRKDLDYYIPFQQANPSGLKTMDFGFLRDHGDDNIINLCQTLVDGIRDRLSGSRLPPSVQDTRAPRHPLYRTIQYFGISARAMVRVNFSPTLQEQSNTEFQDPFIVWKTERWLRLVLWWITKAKYHNTSNSSVPLFQHASSANGWLDVPAQYSSFRLSKSVFILHAILGGRALVHLLDDQGYESLQQMQQAVWQFASEHASQLTDFIKQMNAEVSNGSPSLSGLGGGQNHGLAPSESLSIIDPSQTGEPLSVNDDDLVDLEPLDIKFTK
ncbi:hypothetical protein ABW19_dt0201687 [Dactylella cylindrospora]|nr:hypothetical protein ABW19_dt0201687 [Dactylella cylindrospora]